MPPRDTFDFAAAVALGAALGWSLVMILRSDEEEPVPPRTRASLRRKASMPRTEPALLSSVKKELGRVAREAGEQLTEGALHRLKQRFLGTGRTRGR